MNVYERTIYSEFYVITFGLLLETVSSTIVPLFILILEKNQWKFIQTKIKLPLFLFELVFY